MLIDQGSLLIASGIGGSALALTLLSGWLHNRGDQFLMSWMIGIAVLSAGVVLYSLGPSDIMPVVATAFAMEMAGFTIIYLGSRQFVGLETPPATVIALALTVPVVAGPIFIGFDGFGIMLYNLMVAGLLTAAAVHYWNARAESPTTLAALATLYGATALSFLACGAVLLHEANWMLRLPPDNWAEQFNAIMCIISITGVGAFSMSLTYARLARRHHREARTDPLTGLLNRRALFDDMSAGPVPAGDAVVVFDLDRFKAVNDRFGHLAGDEVLRRFADAMRENLRDGDTAARTGGEEFVMVLRDAAPQLAAATAERVRAMFAADRVETPRGPLAATASAGVALVGDGESFEIVLHRADMSLYRAKAGGRDCVATELQAVA